MMIALSLSLFVACSEAGSYYYTVTTDDFAVELYGADGSDEMEGFTCDGSSALRLKINSSSDLTVTSIKITPTQDWGVISETPGGSGSSSYISTTPMESGTSRVLYLNSEERLPTGLDDSDEVTVSYDITLSFEGFTDLIISKSVKVIRPAVVFIHGMGSNAQTYDPIINAIRAKGLYIDEGLFAYDYSDNNFASFSDNATVVRDAINDCQEKLNSKGYVASKVAVVVHSMAGNLARIYLQTMSDIEILKLITIDSTHSGTQLANFAFSVAAKSPDSPLAFFSTLGAVRDLCIDSDAIKEINGNLADEAKVPTHVITSSCGTISNVVDLIKEEKYLEAAIGFLLNGITSNLLYNGEDSDLVVPVSSQQGGISKSLLNNYVTEYNDQWHCSVLTSAQTATDIEELLECYTTSDKKYTTDGFNPVTDLTYDEKFDLNEVSEMPSGVSAIYLGFNADGSLNVCSLTSGDSSLNSSAKRCAVGVDSSSEKVKIYYMVE